MSLLSINYASTSYQSSTNLKKYFQVEFSHYEKFANIDNKELPSFCASFISKLDIT